MLSENITEIIGLWVLFSFTLSFNRMQLSSQMLFLVQPSTGTKQIQVCVLSQQNQECALVFAFSVSLCSFLSRQHNINNSMLGRSLIFSQNLIACVKCRKPLGCFVQWEQSNRELNVLFPIFFTAIRCPFKRNLAWKIVVEPIFVKLWCKCASLMLPQRQSMS